MLDNLEKLLNPQQYEAVTTINGPLLILAGAGTGKTRVITFRIAHMIGNKKIPPKNILAVTFTNKAANEMKERVIELLNNKKLKPYISTFHSLGLSILKEEIHHIGYRNNFSIYDESDQLSLIKKVVKDTWPHLADKINIQKVKTAISKYKDNIVPPQNCVNDANDPDEIINATVYKEYQHRLKQYNAVDFDDLILLPLILFDKSPQSLQKYQDRFQYIMIDEYQDTNYPQFLLAKKLAQKYGNLCVVGDDDQSIYGWRGADYRNILQFDTHFKGTKVIKLEQNYRSTQNILEAANNVIKNNSLRRSKKLWSACKDDKKISLLTFPTARDEAESIVNCIMDKKIRENLRFCDFAILMRTNHQSRLVEEQLRRNRIPYVLIGGTKFYDRKEVKDIVAYLKFIINPEDEVSLLRIINTPTRSIGINTLETLNKYCIEHRISFIKAVANIEKTGVQRKAVESIKIFLEIINKYRTKFQQDNRLSELIGEFIDEIEYKKEIARISEDKNEMDSRFENIRQLIEDIKFFEEESLEEKSLKQYLSNITLSQDEDNKKEKSNGDSLSLITLHSCKGLEFPIVFMIGMEEGIIPHSRSVDENKGDISEERRLCYVGITRAKKELYLSYSLGRSKYGEIVASNPSRFLKEIPNSLIEDFQEKLSEEDESKIAQFYIDKMKNMVN